MTTQYAVLLARRVEEKASRACRTREVGVHGVSSFLGNLESSTNRITSQPIVEQCATEEHHPNTTAKQKNNKLARRLPKGAHPLRDLSPSTYILPLPTMSNVITPAPTGLPAARYLDVTLASVKAMKSSPTATAVIAAMMPTGRALEASSP